MLSLFERYCTGSARCWKALVIPLFFAIARSLGTKCLAMQCAVKIQMVYLHRNITLATLHHIHSTISASGEMIHSL